MAENEETPPEGRDAGADEPQLGEDVPHREHSIDEEKAIEQRRREDPEDAEES